MKFAVCDGRALVQFEGRWFDVYSASGGVFGPEAQSIFDQWEAFREWFSSTKGIFSQDAETTPVRWGVPSPSPRQVVAIGANYAEHAQEMKLSSDKEIVVFTKFPSCLVPEGSTVQLPSRSVDWEVELVVVIGVKVDNIDPAQAWDHVAGLTVGQDLTDRHLQFSGGASQFSLSKSFPGAGPVGAVMVTPDELDNPDDLSIGCSFYGETVQLARTSQMLRPVSSILADISRHMVLLPGDLVFTGSPSGAGHSRTPPKYLESGQLVSWVEGVGVLSVSIAEPQ